MPDPEPGAAAVPGAAAPGAVAPEVAVPGPELTVPGLQRRLAEFAAARDWQQYHTPKNLVAALTVEAGELLEIFQWLTPEQAADVMSDERAAHRVRDEVADVLAYLFQLCTVLEVDPLRALAEKIERNESRFPVP
ncbi:nucleotide pyrophosphohydrolase [Kitasatospora cineracea]|uniref:nucleotide pyrophosphohydrolase n=1 Tax=Kitasatospora cineracea TaxID=88074 RepID=UPI0037F2A289